MSETRASETDVLNQELRENYGHAHQVEPEDDWRPAIKVLVDGVRYGEQLKYRNRTYEDGLKEAIRRARQQAEESRKLAAVRSNSLSRTDYHTHEAGAFDQFASELEVLGKGGS